MPEPKHNRGNSVQEVATPDDLIQAIEKRFGPIAYDLAATKDNTRGRIGFISPEEDSLKQDWTRLGGVLFLNPVFGNITPWAWKCAESVGVGRLILMLTPLSSSDWATKYCFGAGHVIALHGRVKFKGHKHFFPKDLMLTAYGGMKGFEVWSWRSWIAG